MPTSSSAKKNGPVSRKRVDADPGGMKRATGGSAFTRCEGCNTDIPVATADMHDCQDFVAMKANLDKLGKDAAEKAKGLEMSKTAAKTDAEKGGRKRKGSGNALEKKVKKSKPAKDPNKPKRPNTAYFLFMNDFRTTWREEHPKDKMMIGDVAKAASVKWKSLSEEEKAPYLADAAEKKADYNKAVKSYNEGGKEDKGLEGDDSSAELGDGNEEVAVEEGGEEGLVED